MSSGRTVALGGASTPTSSISAQVDAIDEVLRESVGEMGV